MLHRTAIVIGHNRLTRGAQAVGFEGNPWWHEFDVASLVAGMVVSRLHGSRLFKYQPRDHRENIVRVNSKVSYTGTSQPLIRDVNAWKADRVIELHFNSVPEKFDTSNGPRKARDWDKSLALVWPGSGALSWAPALVKACTTLDGVKAGGVYEKTTAWAGAELQILRDTAGAACILEMCNGKNPDHVAAMASAQLDELADALVVALATS